MKERKENASCYKLSAFGFSAEGIISAYISALELLAKCIRPFPTNN